MTCFVNILQFPRPRMYYNVGLWKNFDADFVYLFSDRISNSLSSLKSSLKAPLTLHCTYIICTDWNLEKVAFQFWVTFHYLKNQNCKFKSLKFRIEKLRNSWASSSIETAKSWKQRPYVFRRLFGFFLFLFFEKFEFL